MIPAKVGPSLVGGDTDDPFELDDAQLAEIETRMLAADRGEVEPAATVLEALRRRR